VRLLAVVCTGFIVLSAFARIVPQKDPLDGVLDAQIVVIVRQSQGENSKWFTVEEVFLGDAKRGDSIDLGDFKLSIVREHGSPVVDPITSGTRILLFLQRAQDSPTRWAPTYFKESFFWTQRPEEVAVLRRAAERTVDMRRQWEKAAAISDPNQRVAALWPFLSMPTYGVSFFKRTDSELQRVGPAAGQYFAEHFDEMSHNERVSLIGSAGGYGSENLHEKLRAHLGQQQQIYEEFVSRLGRVPQESDWNGIPEKAEHAAGEIYYGLVGLAKFGDRDDLPFVRATALWSAKYHQEHAAGAALQAFRDMPDRANLPAMDLILREFLPDRKPGMWSIAWDAERALCQHKYFETVPLLAPLVAEDATATEAQGCLAQIVGRDLGRSPKAWIAWYSAAHKSSSIPAPAPN
jgi:hypothetical protein